YSVYSFHWLEALLLSTVPLTIVPFIPFSFISIALYPLTSILINYSGHCNYRFGNGNGKSWSLFGTNHNEHHFKNKKNYGFLLQFFDTINSKLANNKHK
ncbi:MAG: sterol desaturase family protein, partial [Bacteroidia bacterium]